MENYSNKNKFSEYPILYFCKLFLKAYWQEIIFMSTTIQINPKHLALLVNTTNLKQHQIQKTIALLEDGATIPFIARYRKEMTGSLDEVAIA